MHKSPTYTQDEIARVIGYARVKETHANRHRRKARVSRRRPSFALPRLRLGSPRVAFA